MRTIDGNRLHDDDDNDDDDDGDDDDDDDDDDGDSDDDATGDDDATTSRLVCVRAMYDLGRTRLLDWGWTLEEDLANADAH